MWTAESAAHNDIFCRIVIPCGNNLLYSMDFESLGDINEAFAGKNGAASPHTATLDTDPDGRGTSARTTGCITGGDAFSKDTFACTWDEPCLVSFWSKDGDETGSAWHGLSVGYPGPHTWTACPQDYPGRHVAIQKAKYWAYTSYVFPSARIDGGAPDDGSSGLDLHIHGGGTIGDDPLRFMFESWSQSCDSIWFDDIIVAKTSPRSPPTDPVCPPESPVASFNAFTFNLDPADDKTGLRGWDCCVQVRKSPS
jgi:hypothetical protein